MASQTICCTCGHIIKLANAIAGAKTVCSRCKKVWTVPAQASQGQAAAPSPRRPVVVTKKSSSAGTVGVVLFLAAAVGVGLFFALKDGTPPPNPPAPPVAKAPAPLPKPDPPLRAPRVEPTPEPPPPSTPPSTPVPAPPAPPPPPAEPRKDVLANPTLQEELDLLIYRINTTGLTARVLELRGKKAEAAPLHQAMKGFIADLDKFMNRVEREGHKRYVPDHLLPGDHITHLDRHDFAKLGAEGSEKVLVRFLGALRAGSRARFSVRRGDDFAELDIIYHQRPKELYSIIQVAGIIPGQGGDSKEPDAPVAKPVEPPTKRIPEALKILTDALLRLPASDRERASILLRDAYPGARAPSVLFVASAYLAIPDETSGIDAAGSDALQGYFNAVKMAEIEAFDRPRHLAALADLKARIPAARAKCAPAADVLLRFAAAHAADSGATEAEIQKAAEGLALKRTADDKRWGDPLSVLKADIAAEIRAGRVKDAWRRFDDTWRHHDDFGVQLLGAWLLAVETFERNQSGYDRLAAGLRFIGKDVAPDRLAHVEALAEGVEALAKCGKCKGGAIACPKCGGDSKVDIKCQKCDGKGNYEKGGGTVMCRECLGKGLHKDVDCTCGRSSGKVPCPDCKGKMWAATLAAAELSKVAELRPCRACDGQGVPPVGVAVTCNACFGLGKTLVPASDPKKTLK